MTTKDTGTGSRTRILVMDDEPHIQKIARKMLENFGYAVTLTADGEAAVSEYRRTHGEGSPYHLVILDLTVPGGMGGKQAADEILAMDPDARLVASSGYADDPVMTDHRLYGLKGIITKPYRLAELKETVQKLIP